MLRLDWILPRLPATQAGNLLLLTPCLGSCACCRSHGQSTVSSGQRQLAAIAPDGVQLSMLLGAGSFGRVYSGRFNLDPLVGNPLGAMTPS
jgi:hypothetical protein